MKKMNLHKYLLGPAPRLGLFALLLAAFVGPASAQTLYTNGPANGQQEAFTINYGYDVSNSFILGGASTVSGAEFTLWATSGDTLTSIDWSIGSTEEASDLFAGTASGAGVSSSFQFVNQYGYDIDTVDISMGPLSLGPGTFWFTLQNASVNGVDPSSGDVIYWDENNGPSGAWQSGVNLSTEGDCNGGIFDGGTCSETFQIFGPNGPTSTPEPGTLSLLGTGLFFLLPLSRRLRIKS